MEKGIKDKGEQQERRAPFQSPASGPRPLAPGPSINSALRTSLTLLTLLWSLLTPSSADAQMTGGGGMISLYGVVQVEPGPDVATLEVKGEKIRFAIQNVYCSDRGFSTGAFMTDVTRKDPGLHMRGSEEWLDMLVKEPPSKRVLQMTGVYYQDSRMFVINKLARFSGSPGPR
jgi:hypothetical protein